MKEYKNTILEEIKETVNKEYNVKITVNKDPNGSAYKDRITLDLDLGELNSIVSYYKERCEQDNNIIMIGINYERYKRFKIILDDYIKTRDYATKQFEESGKKKK